MVNIQRQYQTLISKRRETKLLVAEAPLTFCIKNEKKTSSFFIMFVLVLYDCM